MEGTKPISSFKTARKLKSSLYLLLVYCAEKCITWCSFLLSSVLFLWLSLLLRCRYCCSNMYLCTVIVPLFSVLLTKALCLVMDNTISHVCPQNCTTEQNTINHVCPHHNTKLYNGKEYNQKCLSTNNLVSQPVWWGDFASNIKQKLFGPKSNNRKAGTL